MLVVIHERLTAFYTSSITSRTTVYVNIVDSIKRFKGLTINKASDKITNPEINMPKSLKSQFIVGMKKVLKKMTSLLI
jgi:hypothetical protein